MIAWGVKLSNTFVVLWRTWWSGSVSCGRSVGTASLAGVLSHRRHLTARTRPLSGGGLQSIVKARDDSGPVNGKPAHNVHRRVGDVGVFVVEISNEDGHGHHGVLPECGQPLDRLAAGAYGAVGDERKNALECLRADRGEAADTAIGPVGVGRCQRELSKFWDRRAGLRAVDQEYSCGTTVASVEVFIEAVADAAISPPSEAYDFFPQRGRSVADPFQDDRNGVGPDVADRLRRLAIKLDRSTRDLVDPMGKGPALIVRLAAGDEQEDHERDRGQAGGEEEDLAARSHAVRMALATCDERAN